MNTTCPNCDGTGSVTYAVPGGFWNAYAGIWEPDETEHTCPMCHGRALVDPADHEDFRTEAGAWDYDAIEHHFEGAISHVDEPDPDDHRDARLTR